MREHPITFAIFVVFAVFVAILIIIGYFNQPSKLHKTVGVEQLGAQIHNEVGQLVIKIDTTYLGTWVEKNPCSKIIAITDCSDKLYGVSSGFVIVYELRD
jgi:hypothetical protein